MIFSSFVILFSYRRRSKSFLQLQYEQPCLFASPCAGARICARLLGHRRWLRMVRFGKLSSCSSSALEACAPLKRYWFWGCRPSSCFQPTLFIVILSFLIPHPYRTLRISTNITSILQAAAAAACQPLFWCGLRFSFSTAT